MKLFQIEAHSIEMSLQMKLSVDLQLKSCHPINQCPCGLVYISQADPLSENQGYPWCIAVRRTSLPGNVLHVDLKPLSISIVKCVQPILESGCRIGAKHCTRAKGNLAESIGARKRKLKIKFKRKSDIQVVGIIYIYILTRGENPFGIVPWILKKTLTALPSYLAGDHPKCQGQVVAYRRSDRKTLCNHVDIQSCSVAVALSKLKCRSM